MIIVKFYKDIMESRNLVKALVSNFSRFDGLKSVLSKSMQEMKEAGTYKVERVITSPQSSSIVANGKEVINFCANNYLGLAHNPQIEAGAMSAIKEFGYGLSSVRFICGTQSIHKKLEKVISDFHGTDDTILYASCYDANEGIFDALLTDQDAVISDELNHASIIAGIRLCKSKRYRYKHLDMVDLEERLKESQEQRFRMIITDGVFSMV